MTETFRGVECIIESQLVIDYTNKFHFLPEGQLVVVVWQYLCSPISRTVQTLVSVVTWISLELFDEGLCIVREIFEVPVKVKVDYTRMADIHRGLEVFV